MNPTIHDLIHDYLSAAQNCIQQMRDHFKVDDILLARRQGRIPPQGNMPLKYSFHGAGCAFTTSRYSVDADFDQDGECSTFEAWRLMFFAESQPGYYGVLERRDQIEHELQDLERKGMIEKAGNFPNSSFYKLAT